MYTPKCHSTLDREGYGEPFLTRSKDALAALATDLMEFIMISVRHGREPCRGALGVDDGASPGNAVQKGA